MSSRTGLLLFVATLLTIPGCSRSPENPGLPNVVLIVVDTLRPDRIGCYGATSVETPAIDQLAAEGALFENAYTQAAYTLPSVATILTALYPYRHQVRANAANLDDRFDTLAEVLAAAGYRTHAVVGSAVLDRDRNLDQGFETYDDELPATVEVYDAALQRAGVGLGDHLQRRAEEVTSLGLEWIAQNEAFPFFLFIHYFDPHSLYDPPPPFAEKYRGRAYDGEVAYTDSEVGRLISGLDRAGLGRRTLVVLVGDHGEGLGEHGEPEHGFFVYDTTIRVPMVLRFPGTVHAGQRYDRIVRTADLFPTIIDLLDLGTDGQLDGRTLVPLLNKETFNEILVYSEAFSGYFSYGWAPTRCVRSLEWKYVEAPERELYDLLTDPEETQNLYGAGLSAERSLEEEMQRHLREESLVDPVEIETGAISDEHRERLEALGYVSGEPRGVRTGLRALPDPKAEVAKFQKRQEARYLALLAQSYLKGGDVAKADGLLSKAHELTPGNPEVLAGLGAVRMAAGKFREAEELYRQIVALGAENAEPYVDLAVSITNQGRVADALEVLESCPKDLPRGERYPKLLDALRNAHAQRRPLVVR